MSHISSRVASPPVAWGSDSQSYTYKQLPRQEVPAERVILYELFMWLRPGRI